MDFNEQGQDDWTPCWNNPLFGGGDSAIQWNFPSPLIPVSHVRQFTLQESRVRIALFWSVWLACSTHQLCIKIQLLLYSDGYKKATCCHF